MNLPVVLRESGKIILIILIIIHRGYTNSYLEHLHFQERFFWKTNVNTSHFWSQMASSNQFCIIGLTYPCLFVIWRAHRPVPSGMKDFFNAFGSVCLAIILTSWKRIITDSTYLPQDHHNHKSFTWEVPRTVPRTKERLNKYVFPLVPHPSSFHTTCYAVVSLWCFRSRSQWQSKIRRRSSLSFRSEILSQAFYFQGDPMSSYSFNSLYTVMPRSLSQLIIPSTQSVRKSCES